MLEYMLDTNTCIYAMRGSYPGVNEKYKAQSGRLCISSVTLSELHFGAEKSMRRIESLDAIEYFTSFLEVLSFGAVAAAHYGQLRAHLERMGTPCGHADIQIGAHARSEALIVVTNNRREFDRMPGLRVENWVS